MQQEGHPPSPSFATDKRVPVPGRWLPNTKHEGRKPDAVEQDVLQSLLEVASKLNMRPERKFLGAQVPPWETCGVLPASHLQPGGLFWGLRLGLPRRAAGEAWPHAEKRKGVEVGGRPAAMPRKGAQPRRPRLGGSRACAAILTLGCHTVWLSLYVTA